MNLHAMIWKSTPQYKYFYSYIGHYEAGYLHLPILVFLMLNFRSLNLKCIRYNKSLLSCFYNWNLEIKNQFIDRTKGLLMDLWFVLWILVYFMGYSCEMQATRSVRMVSSCTIHLTLLTSSAMPHQPVSVDF